MAACGDSYNCTKVQLNAPAEAARAHRDILISIPQSEKSIDGLTAFYQLRDEAQRNGVADMSLDEINDEIRLAREERDKRNGL